MGFDNLIHEFNGALDDEIRAVRASGGQKTYLSDGRYLGLRDGWHIYSFSADAELHFPDDTPVDLEYRGAKHSGLIVSISAFDVIIALQSHVGDSIATAILYTAPWFLLTELQKRLGDLRSQAGANTALAAKLLQQSAQAREPDFARARQLLSAVQRELGTPLVFNDHQLAAVGMALANDVVFVWGPPGTGKTKTLGLVASALVQASETVLITAHSNVAVDAAMLSVAQTLQHSREYADGRVLRYGVTYLPELDAFPQLHVRGVLRQQNPTLVAQIEALEKRRQQLVRQSRSEGLSSGERQGIKDQIVEIKAVLDPLHQVLKDKESELVRGAQIIGCTLSKATIAPEVYQRRFDAVLIDEASMAYIPHCAFVSALADRRTAIFGDFRQLAPISQGDTALSRRWLERDVFDQAGIIDRMNAGQIDRRLVLLATQYRMHPDISAVPNRLFYSNRLVDAPDVGQRTTPIAAKTPRSGHALACYDLSDLTADCFSEEESHSRFNLVSALAAAELASAALQGGQQQIGIITPYNAQSRLIHRLLKDLDLPSDQIRVATVHRFQGSERDVILFDTVEGPPKKPGRLVSGEMDTTAMRLANVAISRARGKFAALVNCDYVYSHFGRNNSFRRLVEQVEQKAPATPVRWPQYRGQGIWGAGLPGLDYFPRGAEATREIERDLGQAGEEIAILWPAELRSYHFSAQTLKQCDPRRVRFFVNGQGSRAFYIGLQNAQIWDGRPQVSMGLVGIDRKRLWVYLEPDSPSGPVLRLNLPESAKLLYAYFRLVPEAEIAQGTIGERMEKGKSPISIPCPQCGQGLWPASGKYGVYLACAGGCGYTKRITPADATNLARLMGITCGECGSQVQGRKSYSGVFLGCVRYPDCRWTKSLEEIV